MLYVTTRNNNDAFTPHRTLTQGRGPDNGLFVPFQMPVFSKEQLDLLGEKSFGQNVADVLNLFFNTKLDGWDVDFCIGKFSTKLVSMSHRIVIAETWHNMDHDFARVVRNLTERIIGKNADHEQCTNWAWIAVRIAVLCAVFGELSKLNMTQSPIDVALPSGDFAGPMAVWYARKMGLPIGNIICSCDDNDITWDLLHHAEVSVNGSTHIPSDLERLIHAYMGREETLRYARQMESRRGYALPEEYRDSFGEGMFAAVVSEKRRESIINNVYRTGTYILDPGSAMAYGGLQDYRAGGAGMTRPALILTERSPICSADTVARAMGIDVAVLKERLNLV